MLSILYRLGVNAYLTLGNKKSVDILVETKTGKIITIDVKGIEGTTLWPLDNWTKEAPNHFLVLVSFLGKIGDVKIMPEVYAVPSKSVKKYLYQNPKRTRKGIQLSKMRKEGKKFKDNWKVFQKMMRRE